MLYVRHSTGMGFDPGAFLYNAFTGELTQTQKDALKAQAAIDCNRAAGGDAARAEDCSRKAAADIDATVKQAQKGTTTGDWIKIGLAVAAAGAALLAVRSMLL